MTCDDQIVYADLGAVITTDSWSGRTENVVLPACTAACSCSCSICLMTCINYFFTLFWLSSPVAVYGWIAACLSALWYEGQTLMIRMDMWICWLWSCNQITDTWNCCVVACLQNAWFLSDAWCLAWTPLLFCSNISSYEWMDCIYDGFGTVTTTANGIAVLIRCCSQHCCMFCPVPSCAWIAAYLSSLGADWHICPDGVFESLHDDDGNPEMDYFMVHSWVTWMEWPDDRMNAW